MDLHGAVRLAISGAATCNVLETDTDYAERRANVGLDGPVQAFLLVQAARASASRAPTDTACAGASGPSRRRSSSVPPAGARMYRERRGGSGPAAAFVR